MVIASEVFEHMLEPQSLRENAAVTCAPVGGFPTTPNGYGYDESSERHLNRKYLIRLNNLLRRLREGVVQARRQLDHCQWFTVGRLLRMTRKAGLSLIEQENSDFITGTQFDIQLASKLPHWLVSGWYFAFRYMA